MTFGKPSRQVLRRAAIRARRLQRSLQRRGYGLTLRPLALVVAWSVVGPAAWANPMGGQVAAGAATISSAGAGTLNIFQQSERAIINWQSFGIGAGEAVHFMQPTAGSVTLNRVVGSDPSAIFGRLTANGTVMLVNPNGIVFGPTARVDVGGLVATTSNIRDSDFMAGRYAFDQASPSAHAAVDNQGRISIQDSGLAALVAPRVRNSGVIEARLGRVALGAANSFTLDFHGDGLLSFGAGSAVTETAPGSGALVTNSGEIRADGGTVVLTARAVKGVIDNVINTDGLISATTVASVGGRIVLSGGDAGAVAVGGRIDVSAAGGGQGGTVVATGEQIRVAPGTQIDASGRDGGGEIALGSSGLTDPSNPFSNKSESVTVATGTTLKADATGQGDGGNVTLWSTDTTVFNGRISARGGAQGGDGGFAEVSSQKNIGITGDVDLRADQGKTGTFLIDPTDLRITDTASGGAHDGNATDGSVAAADADQGTGATLNTVSRGLLESLAGNANIVLQATGQITVDAMAGGAVNFQTTAGNGVTLQSTQTGGIRFVDANTELRTQGGSITLEALGVGGALTNIGRLSTNGGAVALRASGTIELAGAIDAGAGTVQMVSTAGSIRNAAGVAPQVSGGAVALSAAGGHIGAAGSAINARTARLSVHSGGDIFAVSDMALTDLSVNAQHATAGTHTYRIDASGLSFALTDGSTLSAAQIAQAGLNLTLLSDRSIELGTLDLGSGTLTVTSTAGDLGGAAGNLSRAASVVLTARGSNGNNGAIGTGTAAVNTATPTLSATSGSGGVFVANTGALALAALNTTGGSAVSATGTLAAASVSVGAAALALTSTGGDVVDDGNNATRITAGTLSVAAAGAIGATGSRLQTSAGTLSASTGTGGIHAALSGASANLASIVAGNGPIDITTAGTTTLGTVRSATSGAGNGITISNTGAGQMAVGDVDAGAAGTVSLTTQDGAILSSGNDDIRADRIVARAGGTGGSVVLRSAAARLDLEGAGAIAVTQNGRVALDNVATTGYSVQVNSSAGDIAVGNVRTALNGTVALSAAAGAIVDDGNAGTRLNAGTATLTAAQSIGTGASPVQTSVSSLSVDNTGNVHLVNSDNTLTSLSVTNRHAVPGVANVLQISSPFLAFDVTDDGSQYAVNRIVGAPLNTLSFSGDQTAVIGQVQGHPSGTVSLTATQGDLLGDGNNNTRITGNTVTLRAGQGHVGRASAPLEVNTSMLTLATHGDLFVNSIADLATLNIASTHPDATSSYGMAITAPSLAFAASASAAGQHLQSVVDSSGLDFSYTSDRNITLGQIDVRNSGAVTLSSTAGSIADDGDKATRVLANRVSLSAESIGAAGSGHLDVIAGTLNAAARSGGIHIDVPTPTGGGFTNTLTLSGVSAAGTVEITSHEGDMAISGDISASDQAVRLTAERGSILNWSGTVDVGAGTVSLNAAGSIGSSTQALNLRANGAVLDAQAGSGITIGSDGSLALGAVSATPGGTVSITASSGSLLDDGNTATAVTGQQVNLAAAVGALGSGTAALGVDTTRLSLTAGNDVWIDNAATLAELNLTRTAGASGASGTIGITAGAGQIFDISSSGGDHTLAEVRSSSPLAFGFSGMGAVNVGTIDTGATGSVSLTSIGGSIANAGAGASIAAGTVSLTSGASGSVGTSSSAIALDGTTRLSATAGRDIFVESDAALASLSITSTNTSTSVNSLFGISASGLTMSVTDSGSAQTVDAVGAADFSFKSAKSILVSEIVGTGDIALTSTGTGLASNIEMAALGGRIHGSKVTLATAASGTAGGGNIGTSGRYVRVDTPALVLNGGGNMYVDNAQNLSSLDMTVAHRSNTTYGYGITAGNINSFSITDGATQTLGLGVSGSMDFSYSADRALALATIDAGTSTTGSISLTSRSAPTGTSAQINRSSGSLTAGAISLSAVGTNGGVGAGGTLSTATQNLAVASGGNVSVSNSTTLQSLDLVLRHRTGGATTHSYSIFSTGLVFSISDTGGVAGLNLANITQSGLNLSVTADRTITVSSVNTGSSGSVTLTSTNSAGGATGRIEGGSGASAGSPSITTGELTLNSAFARGYSSSANPLYTAVDSLGGTIANTLDLSNNKELTLRELRVGSSARIATTAGSILQGADALLTAPNLVLASAQAIGATGAGHAVQTDAHHLTLSAGRDIAVHNASDLYGLDITSTHAAPGTQNTVVVTADRLDLALTDSAGGNQYTLDRITDASGLDFRLRTDVDLVAGTADVGTGHSLVLESAGANTSITNGGSSTLAAGRITLVASGSVGAVGDATTRMQTNARSLTVSTGANAFVDNAQDLLDLSLTSLQAPGGAAAAYSFTAPSLTFDVNSDGTTTLVNQVRDTTGLNFSLDTNQSQQVQVVDVQRAGTVALTTYRDLLGSGDPAQRITAGSATLSTTNDGSGTGGTIGAAGQEIHLSSPMLALNTTGSVNIVSDTHIDRLAMSATHPVAAASTYAIASVPVFGNTPASLLSGTDSDAGTVLTSLNDADGLAFSFDSDRAITVGDLNLGATGTVALSNRGGGITGDGVAGTQVQAVSLSMSSDGAIGAAGVGNSIEATVGALSANANGGGVYLNLHGRTALGGVSANGAVSLTNDIGDIALGSIDARGNAVTIDNLGGSILSGYIANTASVALQASGSIGNESAVYLSASGGGSTTLTAAASAANGADGSIAIVEGYGLTATSVVASGAVTLRAQNNLAVGTITGGDAVTLASNQGGITGIDTSNVVTGGSVVLDAAYGSAGIGSSGTRLQVNTSDLTVNTPASFYITGLADLESLEINRASSSGSTSSSSTLSVNATNLSLSATDSGNTTTLANVVDSTGLNFSYQAIGRIAVGSVDVGSAGSVNLRSSLNGGSGSITAVNGSSHISAGVAALTAVGTAGAIGSSGQALGLSVGTLTASSGSGGIHLTQAGSLTLDSLSTTGDLSVTATAGDLTLGAMAYGPDSTLRLTASAGSILAGNVALTGSGADSAIHLSAANGIGAALAPILVDGSAGTRVSATVTGAGSLYLGSTGTLAGGLTTSVADGATQVTAAGNILLRSMTSGTDAQGNDIRVTASAGNITVDNVSAGANARYSGVNLSANAGSILATGAGTVTGNDLNLFGASGVGTAGSRVVVNGQSVQVATGGGAAYLATSGPSVLTNVATNGGQIDVATAHDLLIANASSGGGAVSVRGTAAGVDLFAGNIDAGSGNVLLSSNSTGGTVQDDGLQLTRIRGNTVQLVGDGGVGKAATAVQTSANSLDLSSNAGGSGIHVEDDNANGVTLSAVTARGGAIGIEAAGPLQAVAVAATADGVGNDVTLRTRSGDITVGSVSAGANHGAVVLDAAGSIIDSGSGTGVSAHSARLTANGNIGTVTDVASGAGTPLRVSVTALDGVTATGAGRLVHLLNTTTGTWTLGAAGLTMDAGGSAYLRSAGNLDASGMALAQVDNLLLSAAGTLTLPTAGLGVAGALNLTGGTDVVSAASGAAARELAVGGSSVLLRSGAAGGSTTLASTTGSLDAALTGAGALTVNNTGTLAQSTLQTLDGDITATSSAGLTAQTVVAGGANRTVSLTASTGDLTAGTVDAGVAGTISLNAGNGQLFTAAAALTGSALNLTSGSGIGSADAAFDVTGMAVNATVTGVGDMYLSSRGAFSTGALTTAAGDISVSAEGDFTPTGTYNAGQGGAVSLVSVNGTVTLAQALSTQGDLSVTGQQIALNSGSISTGGAQRYTGALVLGGDTVLTGSALSVNGTVNGPHALTVQAGSGGADFNGAIGDTTRLGALAVDSAGSTRLGAVRAASVATDAAGTTVLAGDVDTTGTQTYGDRVTLAADATLTGTTVALAGGADATAAGGQSLAIQADAVLLGSIGAAQALAALTVNGASTLAGTGVATTGAQAYNGALVLGADQVLDAGSVAFNGTVDGAHALAVNIAGPDTANASTRLDAQAADTAGSADVVFDHAVGGSARLGALTVNTAGTTRFNAAVQAASVTTDAPGAVVLAAPVDTTGTQRYGEAVTLVGDQTLRSRGGSLVFGSTVDGPVGNTLTLRADAGDIDVAGAVRVGSLVSSAEGGETRFRSTLMAEDAGGLQLSGMRFVFDEAVTASTGLFSIANTNAAGSVNFAAGAAVEAATGFMQTGGAAVYLPATVRVAAGPISLQAPAYLPEGVATLSADGDITLSGLAGPGTSVTMAAGPSGALAIGSDDAVAASKLDVAALTVTSAASAQLFGRIGGRGGAAAAASVAGGLLNAPYYMNGTPWGPIDRIATVTASTVAGTVVPSMPGLAALFSGNFTTTGVAADALAVFRDPVVLTVSSPGAVLLQETDERKVNAPAGTR